MNRKQENLILISAVGLGLGLMGFSAFKFLNKSERPKTPTPQVIQNQPINQNNNQNKQNKIDTLSPDGKSRTSSINNKINDVSSSGRGQSSLEVRDFLNNDITDIMPYGANNQVRLFQMTAQIAQNWFNVTKTVTIDTLTGQPIQSNQYEREIIKNCQTDNIKNSFRQWALGSRLQANGDYHLAKQCYTLSAQKGNAYAANRLGELYLLGLGVKKDFAQAKSWLEKSANAGYYFAEFNLGLIYLDTPLNSKTLDSPSCWYFVESRKIKIYAIRC